jgi:purine/pyrimidine-nucleoside phosphorylase
MSHPKSLDNVSAYTKANVYFEGKVISHTLITSEGSKVTLGLIYPGKFHFGTAKSEKMDIVAGRCTVKLDDSKEAVDYPAGSTFTVPENSGFDIEVSEGICEYICSFLD